MPVLGQPLDRDDLPFHAFQAKGQAGEDRLAVHQHRTGAALPELAAVLGSGQIEVLPEHLQEGLVGGKRDLAGLAVHPQGQVHHCLAVLAVHKFIFPGVSKTVKGGFWMGK